jgi:hypothetical protein
MLTNMQPEDDCCKTHPIANPDSIALQESNKDGQTSKMTASEYNRAAAAWLLILFFILAILISPAVAFVWMMFR